jgi:hypothetical protein
MPPINKVMHLGLAILLLRSAPAPAQRKNANQLRKEKNERYCGYVTKGNENGTSGRCNEYLEPNLATCAALTALRMREYGASECEVMLCPYVPCSS